LLETYLKKAGSEEVGFTLRELWLSYNLIENLTGLLHARNFKFYLFQTPKANIGMRDQNGADYYSKDVLHAEIRYTGS